MGRGVYAPVLHLRFRNPKTYGIFEKPREYLKNLWNSLKKHEKRIKSLQNPIFRRFPRTIFVFDFFKNSSLTILSDIKVLSNHKSRNNSDQLSFIGCRTFQMLYNYTGTCKLINQYRYSFCVL